MLFYNLSFLNTSHAWCIGITMDNFLVYTTHILKSTNSGNSWVEQASIQGRELKSIQFIDNNVGWIVGNTGFIYKTINGGTTWVQQASGTTYKLQSLSFLLMQIQVGWLEIMELSKKLLMVEQLGLICQYLIIKI